MAPNDYSCYIYVNNKTDVDFGLVDQMVSYDKWPEGNPPNTIEAHSQARIWLKDESGPQGTEGSVIYQLFLPKYPDTKITFRLDFSDPYGLWYDNSLKADTNFGNLISVNVQPYQSNGHPFTGTVDVYAVGSVAFNSTEGEKKVADMTDALQAQYKEEEGRNPFQSVPVPAAKRPFHANFDIGFKVGGAISINKNPVHESIAIAAFITSSLRGSFPPGTNYNNLNAKQWEYFRGLVWNDDPSCLLFDDSTTNNHDFGYGVEWYDAFENGPSNCMTKRSHFGDLQFLHGMATKNGEAPEITKRAIIGWLEVFYKLACGNQGVSAGDQLKTKLPALFDGSTSPTDDATFKDLLIATTPSYHWANIQSRALGTCLHMIQDSYAIGHTQRRLLNPEDQAASDNEEYIQFKSGTYGRWGPIIAFHNYSGQDSDRHEHYDKVDGLMPVPKDLPSFNKIIGARDAIEACKTFVNLFYSKTDWEDGVKRYLETEVFALDDKAKPANSEVDKFSAPSVMRLEIKPDDGDDLQYILDMERKLGSLEATHSYDDADLTLKTPQWARLNGRRHWLRVLLLILVAVLAFIVFVVLGATMSTVVSKLLS